MADMRVSIIGGKKYFETESNFYETEEMYDGKVKVRAVSKERGLLFETEFSYPDLATAHNDLVKDIKSFSKFFGPAVQPLPSDII